MRRGRPVHIFAGADIRLEQQNCKWNFTDCEFAIHIESVAPEANPGTGG